MRCCRRMRARSPLTAFDQSYWRADVGVVCEWDHRHRGQARELGYLVGHLHRGNAEVDSVGFHQKSRNCHCNRSRSTNRGVRRQVISDQTAAPTHLDNTHEHSRESNQDLPQSVHVEEAPHGEDCEMITLATIPRHVVDESAAVLLDQRGRLFGSHCVGKALGRRTELPGVGTKRAACEEVFTREWKREKCILAACVLQSRRQPVALTTVERSSTHRVRLQADHDNCPSTVLRRMM